MSVAMWNCHSWPLDVKSVAVWRHLCPVTLGGPLGKVSSSAKYCVLVFKASLLWYQGGPSAKVGSSAMFCVLVFNASLLWYWGSISQSRFICQVLCTGMQVISALVQGEALAEEGLPAKFELISSSTLASQKVLLYYSTKDLIACSSLEVINEIAILDRLHVSSSMKLSFLITRCQ